MMSFITSLIDELPKALIDFFYAVIRNPIALILLLLWLIKQYYVQTSKEVNIEGTRVIHINSSDHYNEVVLDAKASGAVVIVNFYVGYWSNACQIATPAFAELSKHYGKNSNTCQFWRINVDTVPDAARANGIISYPTFKIFKDNIEVDEVLGWKEQELIEKIEKYVNMSVAVNDTSLDDKKSYINSDQNKNDNSNNIGNIDSTKKKS